MDNFIINASIIQNANPCEGVVDWNAHAPAGSSWAEVVWANSINLFVAIKISSGINVIMTSPDGATWTQRTVPKDVGFGTFWNSLAWSPALNLLVAVGSSSTHLVMTSPDGINWTLRTASTASSWRRVAWIPTLGIFVAGANSSGVNANIMTSPDGINWTTRNSASFQSRGFAWSPSLALIVAVSDTTPYLLTSPDGTTWTTRTISGTPQFTDIAWSSALAMFVATSSVDPLFARSTDGINWTGYNGGLPHGMTDLMGAIEWAPEIATFVALGYDSNTGNVIFSSKDGLTWTERTCPNPSNGWLELAWSPSLGIFCAVANSGTNLAMTSSPCP